MRALGRRRAARVADARRVAVLRHAGHPAEPRHAKPRDVAKALTEHRVGLVLTQFPSMARLNIGPSWAKSISKQIHPRGTRQ